MASSPPADDLTDRELSQLVERVFAPTEHDRAIAVLIDLPDAELPDHRRWLERRQLAMRWAQRLGVQRDHTSLSVRVVLYRNARRNNADLPATAWQVDPLVDTITIPSDAGQLDPTEAISFEQIFEGHTILLAPTELSTTAPLKLAARKHGFRAATMPGFSPEMVQALRIDYTEVQRQVDALARRLEAASGATFSFVCNGQTDRLYLDLRHRQAHASGGLLRTPGTAGNLPSGEAYIVPYEGEHLGDPSGSQGILPVQLGDEVVRYRIENNRAVAVEGSGPEAKRQRGLLAAEPAYGNLAELGLGVLEGFGIEPIGETLLDEKLGLHIAFGRSDHFGGQVGAADFTRPETVVHIDRVYIRATQPHVAVARVDLVAPEGSETPLIRDGRYV